MRIQSQLRGKGLRVLQDQLLLLEISQDKPRVACVGVHPPPLRPL